MDKGKCTSIASSGYTNEPRKPRGRSQGDGPVKSHANGITDLQEGVPPTDNSKSKSSRPKSCCVFRERNSRVVVRNNNTPKSAKQTQEIKNPAGGATPKFVTHFHKSSISGQLNQIAHNEVCKTGSRRITKTEPLQCPISKCGSTINASSLLVHFWKEHKGIEPVEAFADQIIKLPFAFSDLKFRQICCLGVILYRGKRTQPSPVAKGFAACNMFLPKRKQNWMGSLPLLIMGCRTTWQCVLDATAYGNKELEKDDERRHILVLWVAGTPIQSTINISMVIKHPTTNFIKSTTLTPRHLENTQDPGSFLILDTNHIRLTSPDVHNLEDPNDGKMKMTLTVHDYD